MSVVRDLYDLPIRISVAYSGPITQVVSAFTERIEMALCRLPIETRQSSNFVWGLGKHVSAQEKCHEAHDSR